MKLTSNGRQPQNINSGISQQPLIGSYSNFKLNLRWQNYILQILKGSRTIIEDDLKILKVEYLSNYSLDPPQI